MTVRGKKRTANRSRVAKAKYVVETHCDNGNVFLHGPFRSHSLADKYCREEYDKANYGSTTTHAVRSILAPTGWTRSVK